MSHINAPGPHGQLNVEQIMIKCILYVTHLNFAKSGSGQPFLAFTNSPSQVFLLLLCSIVILHSLIVVAVASMIYPLQAPSPNPFTV